ncbi:MAG: patatin-like phospholipase family protein [Bdellovibrionales bacterium]
MRAMVLTGGGARGAYQAGVLKAVSEISGTWEKKNPFEIVTGVSAGSINATFWASQCHDPVRGAEKLLDLWQNVKFSDVFQSDVISMGNVGAKFALDFMMAPLRGSHFAKALMNTKPLHHLLQSHIDYDQIQKNLDAEHLRALSVTATDYTSSNSITFVQGKAPMEMWDRQLRKSEDTKIRVEHVLGSCAIPIFFPPVNIDGRYFGDGCLRNTAPLSPAIHLGAEKLFIVGVRKQPPTSEILTTNVDRPSVGRVISVVLNAILLDGVDWDIERMNRVNKTLSHVPEEKRKSLSLRPVNFIWISPSEDIGKMAQGETWRLPRVIRYLLKGLGPLEQASGLISYLLFDPTFCSRLAELGYKDAMVRKTEIEDFLAS